MGWLYLYGGIQTNWAILAPRVMIGCWTPPGNSGWIGILFLHREKKAREEEIERKKREEQRAKDEAERARQEAIRKAEQEKEEQKRREEEAEAKRKVEAQAWAEKTSKQALDTPTAAG